MPSIRSYGKLRVLSRQCLVIRLVHRLIALSLELPEDALVNIHNYDAVSETYGTLDPRVPCSLLGRSLPHQ